MSVLYSGRVDIIIDQKQAVKDIRQFIQNYYDETQTFIISFEDKTKAGLPCKPHLHFFFYALPKWSHDGMRRTLSGLGYTGALGSLVNVSKNPKYTLEKTYSYVLKQGNVMATNLDKPTLEDFIEQAKKYNDDIDMGNTFQEHWINNIMPGLIEKKITSRFLVLRTIHEYVTDYNLKETNDQKRLNYPQRTHVLNILHKYEAFQLSKEESFSRYLQDLSIIDLYKINDLN